MNPKLIIQNPTSAMLVGNYEAGWKESDVPALLGSLDEDFLPDVDLDHMGGSVLINGSMSSCHSIDYNVRSSLRKFNIKSLCLIR